MVAGPALNAAGKLGGLGTIPQWRSGPKPALFGGDPPSDLDVCAGSAHCAEKSCWAVFWEQHNLPHSGRWADGRECTVHYPGGHRPAGDQLHGAAIRHEPVVPDFEGPGRGARGRPSQAGC